MRCPKSHNTYIKYDFWDDPLRPKFSSMTLKLWYLGLRWSKRLIWFICLGYYHAEQFNNFTYKSNRSRSIFNNSLSIDISAFANPIELGFDICEGYYYHTKQLKILHINRNPDRSDSTDFVFICTFHKSTTWHFPIVFFSATNDEFWSKVRPAKLHKYQYIYYIKFKHTFLEIISWNVATEV